ncbi:hypothetical protein ABT272_43160 [Streptomyces sp900105245]|uniref:Uncharacterized protein n=1 Tax=Streptomyces sp. 900105245 TaxID=3154379 RepID=A0ABV1UKY5_9ACTN
MIVPTKTLSYAAQFPQPDYLTKAAARTVTDALVEEAARHLAFSTNTSSPDAPKQAYAIAKATLALENFL